VDPELRAYLDAMRQEAAAREAETRTIAEAARQEAAAARQESAAAHREAVAAHREAVAARSEAHVLHEATMTAIRTVIEGVDMLRAAVELRAEGRERDLVDRHIAPLEASAANHERRITALERRNQ